MEELIAKIWSLIGLFTLLQNILPQPLHQILMQWLSSIKDYFRPRYYHLEIPEYKDSLAVNANELYYNIERYLESLDGITRARRLTVFRARNSSNLGFCPAFDEVVEDSFRGVRLYWTHTAQPEPHTAGGGGGGNAMNERRCFTLKAAQPGKEFLCAYFDFIANRAAELN
ncbi:AAA-ATPase At3g28540-like [Cryptomeria japonica]|uniref:AAA-ATPase At3g28540-like n=1 Tax=Cryptomeria japonica TaxID=3369 RepID=UPI0025AD65FF|nr:AAA-ATPase At3g28540-like [Cryptomeria japonica]